MEITTPSLADLYDTNNFLRVLWAEIRKEFGKCAWLYQPMKDGPKHLLYVGLMDIGQKTPISVSFIYQTKSILSTIIFENQSHPPLNPQSDLGKKLITVVNTAIGNRKNFHDIYLTTTIESLRGSVAPYKSDWFNLEPKSKNHMNLTLRLRAFDRIDAETEFLERVPFVMDLLSVETNQLYWLGRSEKKVQAPISVAKEHALPRVLSSATSLTVNIFYEKTDWIDEYQVKEGYSLISKDAYDLINRLISTPTHTQTEINFARACHHYHVAREQDALVYDRLIPGETREFGNDKGVIEMTEEIRLSAIAEFARRANELATVLYLSALEVGSAIGAPDVESCNTCGQQQYKISARVVDYVEKRMPGQGAELLAKIFKDYYNKRSKYLHAGAVLVDQAYAGTVIPLLDPSSNTGLKEYNQVFLINLREWTGYLLRNQMNEI